MNSIIDVEDLIDDEVPEIATSSAISEWTMYMRFATLYATAGFDKDIERVQWRITRERPNDVRNRFRDQEQYGDSVTTFGWRHSNVDMPEEVLDEYRKLIEGTGKEHLFRKADSDAN